MEIHHQNSHQAACWKWGCNLTMLIRNCPQDTADDVVVEAYALHNSVLWAKRVRQEIK